MIRVAIIIPEELSPLKNKKNSWLGGLNYYKNVVSAVYKLPNRQIEIIVFVNSDASPEFVEQFSQAKIVYSSTVNLFHDSSMKFKKPFLYLISKIKGRSFLEERLFLKHHINVFCYGNPLNSKFIKSICWIADFQQMNHPEFFASQNEIKSRNKHLDVLIEQSDSLILSSETALNDLENYSPGYSNKARVLKFVPAIDLKLKIIPIEKLKEKYQFTGEYFYLPNQFWKHKNHHIVIQALNEVVNKQHHKILVLASGSLTDHRNISHIEELISEIKLFKLTETIKLLGVIPYIEVLSLMHFSLALINPSFSEGWSSTVEEAKQLNTPLILSDIPIHLEQTVDTNNTILFDPKNHLKLADILINYKNRGFYISDFDYHENYETKQIEFGSAFQEIVLQVIKG